MKYANISRVWKFLESERLVIFGLTENAARTDAEIAESFKLKKGTVASIRRRLLDAGAIAYVNVPSFNKLGCEIIGFHLGASEPQERTDTRISHYMEFCSRNPQVFDAMMSGTSLIMFTAFKNATEYDSFSQGYSSFFTGSRRTSRAKLSSTIFPFALSRGSYIPNFAFIVHRHFQLDCPRPKSVLPAATAVETPDLSDTEKRTFVTLIENPLASDRKISEIVGLSRQAVTRVRNKLLDDGMFTPVCIPRLYKWGFEICAVAHPKFNMEMPWEKRIRSEPRDVMDFSFFTLSKADESVANYLVAKYSDYTEQLEGLLAWYHKVGAFEDKPEITLFPLERCTELRTFDYAPIARHLLME